MIADWTAMPEGRPQQAQLPEPDSAKTRGILFGDDPDNEDNGILEVTFRLLPVTDSAPDRPVERGDDWTTFCTLCNADVPIRPDGRCPLGHRLP
jgi:hypothetical protein